MYHEEVEGLWLLCYDASDASCYDSEESVDQGADAAECEFFKFAVCFAGELLIRFPRMSCFGLV